MNKEKEIWSLLEKVSDPELPVLSVVDLGIVRDVQVIENTVEITITPTYSGCPAMDVIRINIRMALLQNGYELINIKTVLSPAWTTNWMTRQGKQKLKAYGIAPPLEVRNNNHIHLFSVPDNVECPQCNSGNTAVISEFGSTACKSLHKCLDCNEPFDHFKCH